VPKRLQFNRHVNPPTSTVRYEDDGIYVETPGEDTVKFAYRQGKFWVASRVRTVREYREVFQPASAQVGEANVNDQANR
jgi:hypothetical protein